MFTWNQKIKLDADSKCFKKKKLILRWNLHESLMINCKLISWPFSKCPPEKPFCQHTLNIGITLQAFMT